ncbi:MAG: hypothetical protein CMM93_02355 [Rickettsiales bacterium]|nr:hypothetical protein [Rickettsiales bacterium]|tara:strand:- start:952 stop:1881 length:930 start_codon:yes stop_codon:yes gene_type:complete
MTIAESSQTRVAYIREATPGVTPATPAFKELRYTGESFKHDRQNTTSNEMRPDRNVTDLTQTAGGASGGFNFELSYEAFDDFFEAALCGAWATNKVINGTAKYTHTFEKTYEQGATDTYLRYTGMEAGTLSIRLEAGGLATGSLSFTGLGGSSDDAPITGATYADAPTNEVMSAGFDFADLAITGVTSPKVTRIELQIANNMRQQRALGSVNAVGIGKGRCVVTGTATLYFENKEAYDLFLNGTAADLTFTLGGEDELQYIFNIPKLKFSDADVPASGNDQDIVITLPFQGLYDAGIGATIEIERVPAA